MTLDTQTILKAVANHKAATLQLDKIECEESLMGFVRRAWSIVEPSAPFQDGHAIRVMAAHLEAVTNGDIRRLLINVPPGFTKSLLTNVLWPAWEWGPKRQSANRYISASYEAGLPTRDMIRCRDLVNSQWYQSLWPIGFKKDQDQKTHYVNDKTGWRFASSVGGSLTGYRGDRIIIDDPHDVASAESEQERETALRWVTETVPTRLNKADESAIVVIMQRLHENDVSGLILDKLKSDWTCLILPMRYEVGEEYSQTTVEDPETKQLFKDWRTGEGELLWPERFPEDAVAELEKNMSANEGTYAVSCQLQQRPVPRSGGMFKIDNLQMWPQTLELPKNRVMVRGWDLAASKKKRAAATAGIKMSMLSDGRIIVEDSEWLMGGPLEVETAMKRCAQKDGPKTQQDIPQDPGQAGLVQKAAIARLLNGHDFKFSPESGDKEDRARPFAAQVEAGNVYLLYGKWNEGFKKEAAMFPRGTRKDQIDAASRAYANLLSRRRGERRVGATPETVE